MKRVEIFKAGTHRAMDGTELSFAERDLRVTAAAYNPAVYKAPICIGHPATNAPAYGWVEALEFSGGVLGAWVDQVEPTFAKAVSDGRYRNVSASFWQPDAPTNPKPGVLYLRHVGFLGAAPPAVKGLQPASFAEDTTGTLSFVGEDGGAAMLDAPVVPGGAEDMARRAEALARAEVVQFCDGLIREGRLLPAVRGMTEAILLAAPREGVVAFSEADGGEVTGQRQALMKLLGLLPKVVHFGEFAPADPSDAEASRDFHLPPGFHADPARAELLADAERIMARDGLAFAEAVRRASAGRGGNRR